MSDSSDSDSEGFLEGSFDGVQRQDDHVDIDSVDEDLSDLGFRRRRRPGIFWPPSQRRHWRVRWAYRTETYAAFGCDWAGLLHDTLHSCDHQQHRHRDQPICCSVPGSSRRPWHSLVWHHRVDEVKVYQYHDGDTHAARDCPQLVIGWLPWGRGIMNAMARNRFEKLTQYLHLNNNDTAVARGQPGHDPSRLCLPTMVHTWPSWLQSLATQEHTRGGIFNVGLLICYIITSLLGLTETKVTRSVLRGNRVEGQPRSNCNVFFHFK